MSGNISNCLDSTEKYTPICSIDFICSNSSNIDEQFQDEWISYIHCNETTAIVLIVAFVLLSILIILGNGVILIVVIKSRAAKRANGFVKISLAIADFLQGLITIPASLYTYIQLLLFKSPLNNQSLRDAAEQMLLTYRIYFFSFLLSNTLSFFSLILLSVDRFLAICFPLTYQTGRLMTLNRMRVCVLVTWLLSIAISSYLEEEMIKKLLDPSTTHESTFSVTRTFSIIFGSCYLIIIVLLAITIYNSIKTIREMESINNSNVGSNVEQKFAKTVTIMVATFSISVLPYIVIRTYELSKVWWLETTFELMFYTNSLWNVFIYSLNNKQFRAEIVKFMRTLAPSFCPGKFKEEFTEEPVTRGVTRSSVYRINSTKNRPNLKVVQITEN